MGQIEELERTAKEHFGVIMGDQRRHQKDRAQKAGAA